MPEQAPFASPSSARTRRSRAAGSTAPTRAAPARGSRPSPCERERDLASSPTARGSRPSPDPAPSRTGPTRSCSAAERASRSTRAYLRESRESLGFESEITPEPPPRERARVRARARSASRRRTRRAARELHDARARRGLVPRRAGPRLRERDSTCGAPRRRAAAAPAARRPRGAVSALAHVALLAHAGERERPDVAAGRRERHDLAPPRRQLGGQPVEQAAARAAPRAAGRARRRFRPRDVAVGERQRGRTAAERDAGDAELGARALAARGSRAAAAGRRAPRPPRRATRAPTAATTRAARAEQRARARRRRRLRRRAARVVVAGLGGVRVPLGVGDPLHVRRAAQAARADEHTEPNQTPRVRSASARASGHHSGGRVARGPYSNRSHHFAPGASDDGALTTTMGRRAAARRATLAPRILALAP